jgi:hypothetical protein
MAPYEKASQSAPLIITDHAIGVHTIRQEGQEEFEIRLLPTPDTSLTKTQKSQIESSLPSNKKKQKKNKKKSKTIRFDKEEYIRSIPHKSEITPEEKAVLWVNFYDWQLSQNERQRVSRAASLGYLTIENQTEKLFLRGLEVFIPQVAARRRESMHFARTLVLREQARAKLDEQPIDHDHLAWCYGSATQESREKAYNQGLEDFYQVLEDDGVRRLSDIV